MAITTIDTLPPRAAPSGWTPTATPMLPTQETSSAGGLPPCSCPPPQPATSTCSTGPPSSARSRRFGIEGSGCDGAALARLLAARGQVVVEVNRPDRPAPRPAASQGQVRSS
jgi:hypothetical protein